VSADTAPPEDDPLEPAAEAATGHPPESPMDVPDHDPTTMGDPTPADIPSGDPTSTPTRTAAGGALSAAERGDTMSPARRVLVRVAVIAAIAGGVAGSVLLARGVLDEIPQFVLELNPFAASETSAPLATASGVPSPTGPAADASAGAPGTPTATAPASTSTPSPTSTFTPYPYDEAQQELAATAARDDVAWPLLARGDDLDGAVRSALGDEAPTYADLAPRDAPYTLDDLLASGAATRVDDSTVLLTQLVFVRPGASLVIDAPGTTLRLASRPDAAPARIVAWGSSLTLTGSEDAPLSLVGWDDAADAPADDPSHPRVYVRVESGTLAATDVHLADLGYWSGSTGGLAVTATSSTASAATLTRVTTEGLHIGLYADNTVGLSVTDSTFSGSEQQGVLLGSNASRSVLDGVTVSGSGADGIQVKQGVDDVTIRGGEVSGSARWGLFVDGSPRADGPNANGYGVANSEGLTVDGTTFRDDAFGAVSVGSMGDVSITGTEVDERGFGIRLTDSQGAVDDNTVHVGDGKALVFSGPFTSARAAGNVLSGSGPTAISVEGDASDVDQRDNATDGWSVKWELLIWIEQHPLALLWALVLVIPVLGIGFIVVRARRQKRIRDLVDSTTIALARAEKERYETALHGTPVLVPAAAELLDVSPDEIGLGVHAGVGSQAEADGPLEISPLLAEALAESERLDAADHPDLEAEMERDVQRALTPAPAPAAVSASAVEAEVERALAPALRDETAALPAPAAVPAATAPAPAAVGDSRTTWLVGGPITGSAGRWARGSAAADRAAASDASAAPTASASGAGRGDGSPASPPPAASAARGGSGSSSGLTPPGAGPTAPPAGMASPPTRGAAPIRPGRVEPAARDHRHDASSAVESAVVSTGRFSSVEELAAAAVIDGGKPIDSVARTLRVPTATVAGWVARARRLRGLL
jgi:hypothetical protein